ncbi:MAG: acetate--CoA ligase [Dehalococcoidia bacterium]|nr:acetate--CoA ligase [Dehalococcoidia bacterium]
MDYSPITKAPVDQMKVRPNLIDVRTLGGHFDWQSLEKELGLVEGVNYNLAYAAIDRHLESARRNKVALYWEGKGGEQEQYTFTDLAQLTNRFANVLLGLGVKKGDRVFLFMERIPELYVAFFGALKAGAVVGPLFSAFGPDPVRDRLADSGARVLVTTPDLKVRLEPILDSLPDIKHYVMVNKNNRSSYNPAKLDLSYEEVMANASSDFKIVARSKDDYSIMHYTSGTTGKPKGAVHVHQATIQHYATGRWALDLQQNDLYWCTADPGWVTGTSYGMSAPWTNGISQLIYEGGYRASTWYSLIQKYKVTVWYTAPTAVRMLMKAGDSLPQQYDLSSLRHICSVGEPLNPEAVIWGTKVFKQPIHDNWWQTETGAILIANYPVMAVRPGSMGRPIPGVTASIVDDTFQPMPPGKEGHLAIKPPWPSMFRTYWGNEAMYRSKFKNGWYITGDRARRDEDGYFWFIGRADDVIKSAGHLVGPFEVESALIEHPAVAEAGVIGKPDPIAMEVVKAFVALKDGYQPTEELRRELMHFARKKLAAAVAPREIEFVDKLPKTRSGKIMRRLLKARELGLPAGDTSTLEDD